MERQNSRNNSQYDAQYDTRQEQNRLTTPTLPSGKPAHPILRRLLLPLVLGVWLLALTPGVFYLLAYERTPGRQAAAPESWPADVNFETVAAARDDAAESSLPTIVVALHPRCTCSKATLTELEETAESSPYPYRAVLLIYQPKDADARWQDMSLYREAQQALHARVVMDTDGRLSARFGAETSGQVFLYAAADAAGQRRLLFSGGISAGRGEVGDNQGLASFKTALAGAANVLVRKAGQNEALSMDPRSVTAVNAASILRAPVYGCGIFQHAVFDRTRSGQ